MLRTLRRRSILSHVLPVLIIVPLMGMALIYVIESQVLLTNLTNQLTGQALLISDMARTAPDLWNSPEQARAFANSTAQDVGARVMLLDPNEVLLASSDPADVDRLGHKLDLTGWATVLTGKPAAQKVYSMGLRTEVADALAPVMDQGQRLVGVVRVSHRLDSVTQQFLRLRTLIAGVMVAGLLLGALAGWFLAVNLERPLQDVTEAVSQLTSGERSARLPETGPQELVHLEHSVNTLVESLHSLEQARRQLLSNLVHELGRPLGALDSAIQALLGRSGRDEATRHELLEGMHGQVGRMRRLLDDLVGLHGQVLGTLELSCQPTPMGPWLTYTLAPWREAAREKGLHWQASVPDLLPTLEVDPDRLGQALGNLLSNAIKYTPPRGTVSATAGVDKDALWIQVSDTGPGIAPEEQERIFAPLYRGPSDRRFPQGMGLGLSIARTLVSAHGGRLELQSTVGAGSRFSIRLPLPIQEP